MKSPDGETQYFAPARIDALVNILITIVIFALLILPVVIMYEVTNFGRGQTSLDAIGKSCMRRNCDFGNHLISLLARRCPHRIHTHIWHGCLMLDDRSTT
jgi:hypothetical protein